MMHLQYSLLRNPVLSLLSLQLLWVKTTEGLTIRLGLASAATPHAQGDSGSLLCLLGVFLILFKDLLSLSVFFFLSKNAPVTLI